MAAKIEAQAKEIKRLRMELERTSLKKEENMPEPSNGAPEDFLPEEQVTHWKGLCVGALKEWIGKLLVGEPLRRPLDHAWGMTAGDSTPRDHVLAYRVWEVLCNSHIAYMTHYTARARKDPKGRSPYASLDKATTSTGRMATFQRWADC